MILSSSLKKSMVLLLQLMAYRAIKGFSVSSFRLAGLGRRGIGSKFTPAVFLATKRLVSAMVSTTTASTDAASTLTSTDGSKDDTNPLFDQADLPRFGKIEPYHVTPAVETLLKKMEEEFQSLEEKLGKGKSEKAEEEEVKYDDVLPVVEKIQEPISYAWGITGHLNGVKNGDELRAAYEKSQPEVVKAMTKCGQSKPLYDALVQIEKTLNYESSDFAEQQKQRAVSNSVRSMKLGGVGLVGERKERYNEIRLRLAKLSTDFSNHVLDATKAYSFTVESDEEGKEMMKNVPQSARAMWSQAHVMHIASEETKKKEKTEKEAECEDGEEKGEREEEASSSATTTPPPKPDPENGPWRITLDGPSYIAAMQHIPKRSLRRDLHKAYVTRASELSDNGSQNNIPLIEEILKLKKESSALLGYANYAEQSLASKMAPSVEAVRKLSDLIADKALPAAWKELDEITALARENGGDEYSVENVDKLQPWDVPYWSERLREMKYEVTEEELRPYFALPAVLKGMFDLVNRIFGIEVREVNVKDEGVEVWHEDVRFFRVYDEGSGEHIASFYLDPYSRPENKRGGAWMDVCIGKSDACNRDIPVAYLTCNGSPPVGESTPSLMTFREVETLFHEFGHGLQHMLTRVTVGDVAGINGVEWDAVELPSQFMENWCYDKATVYGFAKHYETGEAMPEELFDKLKQQKTFTAGLLAMRQLYFGQLDMELHCNYDPDNNAEENIFDVQKRIAEKYSPHAMPMEYDRFLCTFNHIFGGGYAAGYFSYKWAEVMSADAFGAFEDVGLDNEEEVKSVGRKFRETVLALGGAVHPTEVFKNFRGREPNPDALLRHNGLA